MFLWVATDRWDWLVKLPAVYPNSWTYRELVGSCMAIAGYSTIL